MSKRTCSAIRLFDLSNWRIGIKLDATSRIGMLDVDQPGLEATDSGLNQSDPFETQTSHLDDIVDVPIEKAKSLKDLQIGALFVGTITKAEVVRVRTERTEPTLSIAIDTKVEVEGLNFRPTRLIYYVVRTGEIIGERRF